MFAKRTSEPVAHRKIQQHILATPSSESVKVVVRCRPFLESEIRKKENRSCTIDKETNQISLLRDKRQNELKTFRYDSVFDEYSTQQDVYSEAAFSVVENSFTGYNGTVFAYGQTGCGKTFTMVGS